MIIRYTLARAPCVAAVVVVVVVANGSLKSVSHVLQIPSYNTAYYRIIIFTVVRSVHTRAREQSRIVRK